MVILLMRVQVRSPCDAAVGHQPVAATYDTIADVCAGCMFGDSITDTSPYNGGDLTTGFSADIPVYGQWSTALAKRHGWQRLNQNMVYNGNFSSDAPGSAPQGWVSVGCTLPIWQASVRAVLSNWVQAATGIPKVIVGGLSNTSRDYIKPLETPPPGWTTFQDYTNRMDAITAREARNVGAFFLRCNTVPPLTVLPLLDVPIGVHPTSGPGGGQDYLYYHYVSALEGGI